MSEAELKRRRLIFLISTAYWLLIFEGVLRKWVAPEFQRALFFLRDPLTPFMALAIVVAMTGVALISIRPEALTGGAKPALLGLSSAALFAASAIGYRGAILTVPGVSFVTAASYTLVWGLFAQTVVLTIYLLWRAPDILTKILGLWKPSMLAGFMGAFASQFWFLSFALTAAANVRTLALVEVLFAQAVAYYSFKQPLSARELSGIALIVVGVALLVAV